MTPALAKSWSHPVTLFSSLGTHFQASRLPEEGGMVACFKEALCHECQGQSRKQSRALCKLDLKGQRHLHRNTNQLEFIPPLEFCLLTSKGVICPLWFRHLQVTNFCLCKISDASISVLLLIFFQASKVKNWVNHTSSFMVSPCSLHSSQPISPWTSVFLDSFWYVYVLVKYMTVFPGELC